MFGRVRELVAAVKPRTFRPKSLAAKFRLPIPQDLKPLEEYVAKVDQRRRRWASLSLLVGLGLLVAAFATFYFAEPESSCRTGGVWTTESTTTPSKPQSVLSAQSESKFTYSCEPRAWPRGPMAMGALGLLLIAPAMTGLLPPGARFGLGSMQFEAGPGTVLERTIKNTGEAANDMSSMAADRSGNLNTAVNSPGSGPTS